MTTIGQSRRCTKLMSCSMIRSATPLFAWISRIRSAVAAVSLRVMPAVGSSSSIRRTSPASSIAISSHCFLTVRERARGLGRLIGQAETSQEIMRVEASGRTAQKTERAAPTGAGGERHLEVLDHGEIGVDPRDLELPPDAEPADLMRPQPGDVATGKVEPCPRSARRRP